MAEELAPPRHSPDYRSVVWFDTDYHFSGMQAAAIEVLWKAWENGTPVVSQHFLLTEIESSCNRLLDLFRRGPGKKAWGTLIIRGPVKGTFRLNVPGGPGHSPSERRSPMRSPHTDMMSPVPASRRS